jgi:N-methylhydantoinase B/oxoprolinase/acetone carboxylase alpha subunit
VVRAGGETEPLPAKCSGVLQPGDSLMIRTPGGGGWG